MDKQFFAEQIGRLRNTYAPGAMSDERMHVMWDRFKNVENRVFKNAVDYLISEYTTQHLPALSKFAEAVGMFRTGTGAQMQEILPAFHCEPCRDFGFGWIGETIVACTCSTGRHISPQELARQQANYEKGKRIMMDPKRFPNIGQALPYNPRERFEA
jgi:hypothetical protein